MSTEALPSPLISTLTLRCSACGAACSGTQGRETLTCAYCGTEQRLVDARQFVDHLTVQVQAFLRQSLPLGVDPAGPGAVDPVARNAIFSSNVAPWLSVESSGLRFRFLQLISHPLLVLPFSDARSLITQDQPAGVALFGAKVQSVTGLAANESSKRSIDSSFRLGSAYGATLVAANLLRESKPERFHLAALNFDTSGKELREADKLEPLSARFVGLANASRGLDALRGGDFQAALEWLTKAQAELQRAMEQIRGRLDLAFTASAVSRELSVIRASLHLADAGEAAKKTGHPQPIGAVSAFNQAIDFAALNAPDVWGGGFKAEATREELARRFLDLRRAKNGEAAVRLLAVGTGLLVPYWVIQLSYTFETGALWRKQARNVPDLLLVAATFPFEPSALGLQLPSVAISDVFRAGTGSTGLSGFVKQVSGTERSLSQSAAVHQIFQTASVSSISGTPAVPPLAGSAQAITLCEYYLNQVRLQSPKFADQFKSKALSALDVVYIPTDVRPGATPISWLGDISPRSVGRIDAVLSLAS